MKILVLAPQPFFQNRGTPIAVRLLVETLAAGGHEVHLLVFHEGDDIHTENVTIHRTPALPGLRAIPPGFSIKKIVCDFFLAIKAFRLQRKFRFDIIHAVEESVFIAMVIDKFAKVPYVYDLDSLLSDQLLAKIKILRPFRRLFEFMERAAVGGSTGVIPVCRALEEKILAIDKTKLLVRLEDISFLQENTSESREILRKRYPCRQKIVMYVGNLEKYQGVALLLEAFAQVDQGKVDCTLICIGGTPADITLYSEQAEMLGIGDRALFIGPRPLNALGIYLAQADALVSPRTEGENTPMKIYSYMDSGKPVLATRIVSHTQVLDEENAYLAAPDPTSMAAALTRLLTNDEEAFSRAKVAKQKVAEEYSRPAYENKLTNFYKEVEHVRNLRV